MLRASDYARDIKSIIEAKGWTDILVVGHSMGARTALALGHLLWNDSDTSLKDKIRHIVCVDISLKGAWGGGMGKPLANFLENLPYEFADRKSLREYLFATCPDPAIAQYLSAVAINASPADTPERWIFPFNHEAVIGTIHQANAIEDHASAAQKESLAEWTMEMVNAGVPVTFLRGESSKVWLKADFDEQRVEFQHRLLEFQEWEKCGHGLPFEQRARFVEFLKEL